MSARAGGVVRGAGGAMARRRAATAARHARLGRAYVVEGSALGGRVLHAHVTRRALASETS